ncbi:MAG TPA: DUF47 domain-containing protein [Gemmatimonas aurantiaca]|uniref:DUF47 domain-containing protein n=2 Tax=Gemmatimonas aurantiaca TaxID=173480 RepID=A0A3D4V4N1_9BACT|nr:DUF47 family protein [Gemmatimonas aurantiaca]BAH39416.1 putative Pit accessory protein [Gemmatimonas aurantiaca T-27]HCT56045.1 DUF47 domain-containing protein [Gemmatimonas aurantiaca]
MTSALRFVKLFSRDETFFDHFRQLAVHIGQAAALLRTLFENPANSAQLTPQIKKVETDGDAIVQLINQRIDTSFVTPLDREDIHLLSKRLDNVIDLINGTSRRVAMFRIVAPRDGGVQMADVLVRASKEILAAVGDVTKRQRMMEHGKIIKQLEEEGDVLYAQAVGALFERDEPAIEVLKWKEIFDSLEEAIDECEDVSNVLESIALKNS